MSHNDSTMSMDCVEVDNNNQGEIICRPFLKWVGGKSQLLNEIHKRLPAKFNRYFEPFIGGGALLFNLQPSDAVISDINSELINAYKVIRDNVDALIEDLKKHYYDEKYFYKIRNIDRTSAFLNLSPVERASRLIFLNKTCFNGLYRVNSKGFFNVPFGQYTNPKILDAENLYQCSKYLQQVTIVSLGFEHVLESAKKNDFVYFDPPYVPLNATSNFTSYNAMKFDVNMQYQLQKVCEVLTKKGVKFLLSNSSSSFVLDLYKGFRTEFVKANRSINSVGSKRGEVKEVLVSNY